MNIETGVRGREELRCEFFVSVGTFTVLIHPLGPLLGPSDLLPRRHGLLLDSLPTHTIRTPSLTHGLFLVRSHTRVHTYVRTRSCTYFHSLSGPKSRTTETCQRDNVSTGIPSVRNNKIRSLRPVSDGGED